MRALCLRVAENGYTADEGDENLETPDRRASLCASQEADRRIL